MEKMVNGSKDTVEYLFECEKDWNAIMRLLNNVRIPSYAPIVSEEEYADPTSVTTIMDRAGIRIHDDRGLLKKIHDDTSIISSYSKDLFVIEDDENYAERLSRDSGVVVLSSDNVKTSAITKSFYFPVGKTIIKQPWKLFFHKLRANPYTPSNALIIIDRYLFAYDGDSGYLEGLVNLDNVLRTCLPEQLDNRFDILLIFGCEYGAMDTKTSLDKLSAELNAIKDRLHRPYKVNLEIIAIDKECELWSDSHDRRIVSNYYIVHATRGLKAFLGKDCNIPHWEQTIFCTCSYANLGDELQGALGYAESSIDSIIESVSRFIHSAPKERIGYSYYCNRNKDKDIHYLKNHLLE